MQRLSWLVLAITAPALAAAPDGGVSAASKNKPDGGVTAAPEKPVGYLKTADDKELYALGYSFGRNLQVFDLSPAELEVIRKALTEGATDKKPLVPLETYGPKIQELAAARHTRAAQKKEARDKPYLDAAAKQKGAQVLPSGVVYIPEKEGTGPNPKSSDEVTVNYAGKLSNGTEFDSSYKRKEPLKFQLDKVIPCWTEGVQKMKVGGKARIVCPAKAGYGENGQPRAGIPGGSVLDFSVELLDAKAPPPPPVPTPGASPGFTPPPAGK
ncbi:MAG TPA: FKBP-type peptidyl-prolyl cis-trans isomerase [Myxococcaceae bacterium]|jgi:FKBP-type peptidyl-prolyl cis-trans isomerase FkpA